MLLTLFAANVIVQETRILFLGNSHTTNFNVPDIVRSVLESSATKPRVFVRTEIGGFLDDIASRTDVHTTLRRGKWSYVVLQGQKLSSSHRYEYSKDSAIFLANMAKKAGAKVLLFAEWSRKGIDETAFQINGYKPIAKASGAAIVPTCRAFDLALAKNAKLDLWAMDGNHSSHLGAFLAACTIANAIHPLGQTATYYPKGITRQLVQLAWKCARETEPIR